MNQTDDKVRVLSPGGVFLRKCTQREAAKHIREKRFKIRSSNRRRVIAVIDLHAKVAAQIPMPAAMTYREQLGDTRSIVVIKRLGGRIVAKVSGFFVEMYETRNWDPGLTFKEARDGKLISDETKLRRELERQESALRRTA
jgi:hypothetical protein